MRALLTALALALGGGVGSGVTAHLEAPVRRQVDQGVAVLAEQLDYWHDRAVACEETQP